MLMLLVLVCRTVGPVEPLVGLLDVGPDVRVRLTVVVTANRVTQLQLGVGDLKKKSQAELIISIEKRGFLLKRLEVPHPVSLMCE